MYGEVYAFFTTYSGHQAYTQGDMKAAREIFGAQAAENSNDWRALYNIGTIALREEQYADAVKHFEKVLELQPDNDSARERCAYARRREEERQRKAEQQQKKEQQDKSDQQQQQDDRQQDNEQQQDRQQQSDKEQREDNKEAQDRAASHKNETSPSAQGQQQQGQQQEQGAPQRDSMQSTKNSGEKQSEQQHESEQRETALPGEISDKEMDKLSPSEGALLRAMDEVDRNAQKHIIAHIQAQNSKGGHAQDQRHNW